MEGKTNQSDRNNAGNQNSQQNELMNMMKIILENTENTRQRVEALEASAQNTPLPSTLKNNPALTLGEQDPNDLRGYLRGETPFPTPSWELESCSETSSSINPRHISRRVIEEPITPGRRPGKEVIVRSFHKHNEKFGLGESGSRRSDVRINRRTELNYSPVNDTDPTYQPEVERTSGNRISVHDRLGRPGAVFDARRRVEQIRSERDTRQISQGQAQSSEGIVRQHESELILNAKKTALNVTPAIPIVQAPTRAPGAMEIPPYPVGDRLQSIQLQLDAMKSQPEITPSVTFRSPFSQEIRDAPLPPSFKLPTARFDGSGDPRNHVDTISEMMELHQVSDLAKCRCLAASLTQEARDWYRKIPAGSIASWEQFANMFFQRYQAGRRFSMPVSFLSNIRQERDESVSDYLARFQQERSKVIGASEEAVKNFLIAGVRQHSDLWKDIQAEEESITLARFYQIASKYQRVERSIALLRSRPSAPTPPVRPREDWRDRDHSRFSKKPRFASKEVIRSPIRNQKPFTPLVASLSEIYANSEHIKKIPPPRIFPSRFKNPRKYCEFHRDIGHETNDCTNLRKIIEDLLKAGHLQEYVKSPPDQPDKKDRDAEEGDNLRRHSRPKRVGMIFGGPSVAGTSRTARSRYAREARSEPPTKSAKVLAVGVAGKRSRPEAEIIGFSEDEECPGNPSDGDALVIDTNIANTEVCRILVDNGSVVNILFLSTLHAMGFDSSDLRPMPTPLHGFNSKPTIPVGAVKLPVTLGQEEHKRKLIVEFLVVDCQFAYNAVFGRPLLMATRAATSIVCQSMKFRTPTGVGIVHSSSKSSRECYKNAINMAENSAAVSAMPIETQLIQSGPSEDNIDPRNLIEEPATGPVEQLREVIIDDNEPTKVVKIGANLDEEIAGKLITFLRSNTDVFAFKHADMVGIDPEVACHRLNADKDCRPIRQKRRALDGERSLALKEEVDRLIEIRFIREVDYPQWIANPVLVKKANGKWRTCIDFTNLNKACPKDSFPLPRIDQLVDATAGHALLSFMDAYSGYNQIPMYPPNEEHTSFITDRGLYCYKVMPFGLRNAGATYQRLVNKIFAKLIGKSMEVYVDDMLVKSREAVDHIAALNDTFEILRKYKMRLNPLKCAFGVGSGKFLGFMVNERGIEANPDKIQALLDMQSPEKSKQVQSLTGRVAALNRFVSRATDRCLPFFDVLKGNKKFQWNEECEQAFQDLKQYLGQPPLLSKPKDGETLILYLAVSPHAISAALMREEDGIQRPVYFVSKRLIDAETRYPEMEKLALALLIASRKLRPYFLAHSVSVLTNYPLRKIMQKPETSGRMMQWAIELSQFDIAYTPRASNKGQALADFVSEFSYWPKEISPQANSEAICQIESTSDQIARMSTWTVYVDGSSNETSSGAGVYLKTPEGKEILGAIKFEFRASNNEAEYEAILAGISLLNEMGAQRANIFSDSKLAVSHISGAYQVKGARLALYLEQTKAKLANFQHYTVQSISRSDNLVADALAKLASSLSSNSVDIALFKYLRTPSITVSGTESLSVEERTSWMDPIVGYLKEGIVPS